LSDVHGLPTDTPPAIRHALRVLETAGFTRAQALIAILALALAGPPPEADNAENVIGAMTGPR